MSKLQDFISILVGEFDNKEQFQEKGNGRFPFAEHVNTICNDKIVNLPDSFEGLFLLEESYYTTNGNTTASPHLFLFTEKEDAIQLESYDLPEGYSKTTFTYQALKPIDYSLLTPSKKFTPAIYKLKGDVWEGGSVSMFSPVLRFTLWERFSNDMLEVSEKMDSNGKIVFGFDEPLRYRRK